ncbi:DUF6879 family protein [Streptomyces sp. S.PB5]|uniref:DUF6879 family protein n=1 Tax=Streptomyces sp. S.PB5 TaxID=3020844 RepID=UPI0025B26AFB|nr:DUF6879 family protein [Streptomyces sp. S.PB5]MDN3025673.1 hypothetical protein [Streptomyces sp. S.PB5]
MPDVTGSAVPDFEAPGICTVIDAAPEVRGEFLPVEEYLAAFREDYARPEVKTFDKLECGQVFKEPGSASWGAFSRGDWPEAVRLLQDAVPAMGQQFTKAEERGLTLRRVRYVEVPPSDYLVWEMAVLRERVRLGEQVRVFVSQGRPGFSAPPPRWFSELVIIGTVRLYELRYKPDGVIAGAFRFSAPELIDACRADFDRLYGAAEDLPSFHDRVTGPLLRDRCAGASA